MKYWSGLYPESMKEIIVAGADAMLKTAMRLLGRQGGAAAVPVLLPAPRTNTADERRRRRDR